jgi:hypothetical protein
LVIRLFIGQLGELLVDEKVGLGYWPAGGGDFRVKYAKLTSLATGAKVTDEIFPEQEKLNEEIMLKYNSSHSVESQDPSLSIIYGSPSAANESSPPPLKKY